MALSLSELKKSSGRKAIDQLNKQLADMNPKGREDDNRIWKPTRDKSGNGYAVIRFLPAPKGEEIPFVRIWHHGFKGPTGKYYIENSLTTLGKDDPCSEMNKKLWNSGIEKNKKIVSEGKDATKRRLKYIANIYVIKDTGNPENEGKVMLYEFGAKIFQKINDAMNPKFEDQKAINPFDLWEGANFKVRIATVKNYPNYDESGFDPAGPLFDDDDKIEQVWAQEYPLQPFLAEDKFKSYAQLEKLLAAAMGNIAQIVSEGIESAAGPDDRESPPFDEDEPRAAKPVAAKKEENSWTPCWPNWTPATWRS